MQLKMKQELADNIFFKREQLYEEIWSTPTLQLAKKYGLSDVGLAKICRKMKIPRPPRGYWAKRSYGQPTNRQPLPPATKDTLTEVMIDRDTKQLAKLHDKRRIANTSMMQERQKIRRLKVALRDMDVASKTRAYITAMKASSKAKEPEMKQFLKWAETYANHIDPTTDFRIELLDR